MMRLCVPCHKERNANLISLIIDLVCNPCTLYQLIFQLLPLKRFFLLVHLFLGFLGSLVLILALSIIVLLALILTQRCSVIRGSLSSSRILFVSQSAYACPEEQGVKASELKPRHKVHNMRWSN